MGIQSLHSHTYLSDGQMSHQEALDLAQKYGIEVVAFTEHDVLPNDEQIQALKDLNHPTKWLVGIEMSAAYSQTKGGTDSSLHIVGLFVDPNNKELLEHCRKTREERIRRMGDMVKGLNKLGFDITPEDCLKAATGKVVGLPHIAKALKAKEGNLKVLDRYKEEMRKEGESNPEIERKYKIMMQQGEGEVVYTLILAKGAYKSVQADYQYWVQLDEAVSLIRNAGGLAFIAHYTTAKTEINTEILEELVKEGKIDGLETVFGFWGHGNDEGKIIDEDKALCRKLIEKYNKLAIGGGDTHTEKDFINFATNAWYSDETIGMLEKIIEAKKPDLTWSNL